MAGPGDKGDEEREDWFEVMGLSWDATADDVKDAYKKLALKYHPDKNRDDPKAADKFVLVNKAKTFLSDDAKRAKLAEKKKREAERDRRNKKRFAEMDEQRKRFKGDLDAKEAAERAKAQQRREAQQQGLGGQQRAGGSVNMSVLDELRRLGQQQREEEARRIEELLRKSRDAAAAAVAASAGPPPPGGVREKLGEEDLRQEEDVEDGDGDGDGEAPLLPGAVLPPDAFTSAEVKVKWKRRSLQESHSDDSIYKLLSRFGPIKSVEMAGTKGNAAKVVFEERAAAERAVQAYEFDQDMRITIPQDKKYRLFNRPQFDASAVLGSRPMPTTTTSSSAATAFPFNINKMGGGVGAGAAAAASPAPAVNEGDVLARMRAAAAERKRKQEEEQAAATAAAADAAEGEGGEANEAVDGGVVEGAAGEE